MATQRAPSPIELGVARIRELSKRGRHDEALSAAETLVPEAPQNRDVLYLIAANQRCLHQISAALTSLERLEQRHPRFSLLYQERGYCYVALRDAQRAIDAFSRAVDLNPALIASWTLLEGLCRMVGEGERAAAVAEQLATLKKLSPEVVRAGSLFSDGDLSAAQNILQAYLLTDAKDAEALRLLGRIKHQCGELYEAESLLEATLELAPNYRAALFDYVGVLLDQQKYFEAVEATNTLLTSEPAAADCLSLRAAAHAGLGKHDAAIAGYRQLLAVSVTSPELYVALGHSLRSVGHTKDAIECYQKARSIRPSFGVAYWSLANLKTYRFLQDEITCMQAEESASTTQFADRYHLCFALGKAHEDRKEYAESWRFYERGNSMKHAESRYDPDVFETETGKQIDLFTSEFFASRAGLGVADTDPIFVVGLPRSGSTLLEQVLASHSQIEATQELPEIRRIVSKLRTTRQNLDTPSYPRLLAELALEEFRRLGESYLAAVRPYRNSRPFFIDKMPNNFRHIGLIHLILPNAKIIDIRREPMACCFGNLKQLFASGQEFSYRIEDIARYYRTYLELMRHWDAILPGRVLRVSYEDLVDDLSGNVERILDFCGLEFETSCLQFHQTKRSVGTPSSEQVRQPIFHDAVSQWQNYAPWLDQLKIVLGDALVRYRE